MRRTSTRPRRARSARDARAEATYEVAKEKCDDAAGNARDVCMKEANAAYVKAKADAKVDRVAADTRKDSAEKTADARREAASDKRDADYKVAIETLRCARRGGQGHVRARRQGKVRQELICSPSGRNGHRRHLLRNLLAGVHFPALRPAFSRCRTRGDRAIG